MPSDHDAASGTIYDHQEIKRPAGLVIGFLNPWRDAAENQAFQSLAIAASRCGHRLVHVSTSGEVEAAAPDFVIAVASTQPKLTSHPTFAQSTRPERGTGRTPHIFVTC